MAVTIAVIAVIALLTPLLCAERSLEDNKMSCTEKFTEHGVVPDVIEVAPPAVATVREIYICPQLRTVVTLTCTHVTLQVEYPGGRAECGNVLTPTIVSGTANVCV